MGTLGEIWAVSQALGPLDIRILIPGVPAFKMTVTPTPSMIVTPGADDSIIITNLSLSPIEIGTDRGLMFGQGTPIPAKSQWSPTGGVKSIWGSPHYYDRNPLDIVRNASATRNAGDAGFNLWTYTVPAGRRGYLESCYCFTQITTQYANDFADLSTYVSVNPGGNTYAPGAAPPVAQAQIWGGLVIYTTATGLLGASIELQPGDVVAANSIDSRAAGAGAAFHLASAKFTEFDQG